MPPDLRDDDSGPRRYPGTPRWVKVLGTIAIVVAVLFAVMLVTRGPGGHGPSRHTHSEQR